MQFISVRDLKLHPGQVWEALGDASEIVVTSNGKPIAVLTGVTPETLDETLSTIRQARAHRALSRLRRQASLAGAAALTDEDIDQEVSASRRQLRTR